MRLAIVAVRDFATKKFNNEKLMKKTNVIPILNPEVIERVSEEEMMVLKGGIALDVEIRIEIENGYQCNSGNCVAGCACS